MFADSMTLVLAYLLFGLLDTFLNVKVRDSNGNLETYFEVLVKERI